MKIPKIPNGFVCSSNSFYKIEKRGEFYIVLWNRLKGNEGYLTGDILFIDDKLKIQQSDCLVYFFTFPDLIIKKQDFRLLTEDEFNIFKELYGESNFSESKFFDRYPSVDKLIRTTPELERLLSKQ